MSSPDKEIVSEFVMESREHLADIETQLLAIEANGQGSDPELVNEAFRAIHSIKGAAGFLGFTKVGELAHEIETVLNLIRNGHLVPNAIIVDIMLRASDTLSAMIENIDQSNEFDILQHLVALRNVVAGDDEEASPDERANESEAECSASEAGFPPPEPTTPEDLSPRDVVTAPAPAPETNRSTSSEGHLAKTQPQASSTATTPTAPSRAAGPTAAPKSGPVDTSIRVAVSVVDSLMNLAGELVLARNQLLQAIDSTCSSNLSSVASRLDQVTSELQETIMQARMQPVGSVFDKFPRIVRDLSKVLRKQCELKVIGSEVELDKSIIEAIGDPLTHLVRNSVDHGIESPDKRIVAGKQPVGTVTLKAYHQAGKVNISILDDGAGIVPGQLKEKAVARGFLAADQAAAMNDREALRLVFHPGFSMAHSIADVRGRGVGMDVVKTNIEKLGGAVGIESEPGKGTSVNIRLPLTLAIVPSLIVSGGGQCLAIPQSNIRELVRIQANNAAGAIGKVKEAEVFRLRERLLPLVRLCNTLNVRQTDVPAHDGIINIVVVESGQLRYGLIVDELHDSEEIVVKPLGRHLQVCQAFAGATILGDGQVALILDVTGIASHSRITIPDLDELGEQEDEIRFGRSETQPALLFTNHPEEYFAVPMAAISRLERVHLDQVSQIGKMHILQYRGTSLPLLSLEDLIQAKARLETSKVYVVVFSVLEREVGLIVPNLLDIRSVCTAVDTATFGAPGVMGSVEADKHAVRLLDLYQLAKLARPDWFESMAPPVSGTASEPSMPQDTASQKPPLVLVAEDSSFFRKQVVGFLEEAGYDTVTCEDGEIAWETLKTRGPEIDLVLTDIEMPNMDGCELAAHIKQEPTLSHLPVIALTSLSSDKDVQRGTESGIDDYQIKLDRERLIATLARYLHEATGKERPQGKTSFEGADSICS